MENPPLSQAVMTRRRQKRRQQCGRLSVHYASVEMHEILARDTSFDARRIERKCREIYVGETGQYLHGCTMTLTAVSSASSSSCCCVVAGECPIGKPHDRPRRTIVSIFWEPDWRSFGGSAFYPHAAPNSSLVWPGHACSAARLLVDSRV